MSRCAWCRGPMEPADADQCPPYCSVICREEHARGCQYGHNHRTARDGYLCYMLEIAYLTQRIRTAPDVVAALCGWSPGAVLGQPNAPQP